jgi:hypothetical protein
MHRHLVMHERERQAAVRVGLGRLLRGQDGAARLRRVVLLGEERADDVGEPEPVPGLLVDPVDRDHGHRGPVVVRAEEDGELLRPPEVQVDRPLRVVGAPDLDRGDVVERAEDLGPLHQRVDVARLVHQLQELVGHAPADDAAGRARVVLVLAEDVHDLLHEPRLVLGPAVVVERGLRLLAGVVPVALEVVEGLVLERVGDPDPLARQAVGHLLGDPRAVDLGRRGRGEGGEEGAEDRHGSRHSSMVMVVPSSAL